MNDSVRYLLRQGADTVEKPRLDVGGLVARAERRMFRRRLATVAASTLTVTVVVAGAVTLRPDERSSAPPPVVPVETPEPPETPEPTPTVGSPSYFDAHPGDSGEPVTIPYAALGQSDIYLRRDGEPPRRIVATRAHERCPAVSPDAAHVTYLRGKYSSDVVPPADVVVVSLDPAGNPVAGSQRVVLRGSETCPQWSPDGRRLALVAEGQDWSTPELRVVTLGGKERLLTLLPPYVAAFAWSPDGDAVAYLTEDAVWIAPSDGGEPKLFWRSTLTPDRDPQGIPLPRAPTSLSWLSTGELAVVVLPDKASEGWPYVPEGRSVLHVIDIESGRHEKVELTGQPVFSPDASRLAFASDNLRQIRVHDRRTGSTVTLWPKLDDGGKIWVNGLSWSPDGERLLTFAQRGPDSAGGPYARVSIAPEGGTVEVLTPWTSGRFPW